MQPNKLSKTSGSSNLACAVQPWIAYDCSLSKAITLRVATKISVTKKLLEVFPLLGTHYPQPKKRAI
jgi:hypothetical protein